MLQFNLMDNQFIELSRYEAARRRAELRLDALPDLSTNESIEFQSFIRRAGNIWRTIDEVDKPYFMRRIKDKVIGCLWISEQRILDANNWIEIRNLLEEKWRENNDLYLLRARLNELHQKYNESIFEYAERTKQILKDFELYYGEMSPDHKMDLQDRIKEKFEEGVSNGFIKKALITRVTEKLNESINIALRLQHHLDRAPKPSEIICNFCNIRGHRQVECRTKQDKIRLSNEAACFGMEYHLNEYDQIDDDYNEEDADNSDYDNNSYNNVINQETYDGNDYFDINVSCDQYDNNQFENHDEANVQRQNDNFDFYDYNQINNCFENNNYNNNQTQHQDEFMYNEQSLN